MARALGSCWQLGCDVGVPAGRDCPAHPRLVRRRPDVDRPSAAERGYDSKWRRIRAKFLAAHPVCLDCGGQAQVPDHCPLTRRELLEAGDPHPDAWHHLVPRCVPCHNTRSALLRHHGAGGWGDTIDLRREATPHG